MSHVEQRLVEREELNWDVTVMHPQHGTLSGRVQNLSDHGMFIALPEPNTALQGMVSVRMYRDDVMLFTRGQVVHNRNNGVGLLLREPITVYELFGGHVYDVAPRGAVA
jgi:hypothetical protein